MKDQVALFQYIEDRDQTPWDSLPKAMVPAPKTLMFGKDQPVLRFEAAGEPSAIRDMVERASQLVERNRLQLIGKDEDNARLNASLCASNRRRHRFSVLVSRATQHQQSRGTHIVSKNYVT